MDDRPPPVEQHVATDRFGKQALQTAHELGRALDEDGGDGEPVVVRRGGPHRSIRGLEALLDEALDDHEEQRRPAPDPAPDPAD